MIERLSKSIVRYYQISLVVAMVATLAVILYFWKLGFIDGSRSKNLHQASYILETYETKNILFQVKDLILNENPKLAIQKMKDVEKDLEKVHRQIEISEYAALKKSIQRLKTSAANIISFSKMNKVLGVFNGKMDKFYDFVKKNKWKTLSRMSDRIFSQTRGHIHRSKLDSMVKQLSKEFSMMTKITENSILSSSQKSEVISRINNLQTEVSMLKKYAEERRFFFQLHKEAKKDLKLWLNAVAPELTLQKVQVEQIGRYYVIGLLGLLALLAGIFFMSFLANKFYYRRAQEFLEKDLKILIGETLQKGKPLGDLGHSEGFDSYVKSMANYFKKRMSFGSIFQDALPLSSVLLDNNLKVLWSNKNFSKDWEIPEEDMAKDYMSWDFLNKLTNIGSEDPVLEALKHGVAGIYQIQVKPSEKSPSRPYEMFVAPVSFQTEPRVMLFFYDLTNLQQTIQDQAQSLVTPIRKSLRYTQSGDFEKHEELEYEFKVAQADDVFQQFVELNHYFKQVKQELENEITILSHNIQENDRFNKDAFQSIIRGFEKTKGHIEALKIFKENVVTLSSISNDLDRSVRQSQEVIYANMSVMNNSIKKLVDLEEVTVELCEFAPKFGLLKEEIKHYKLQFNDTNSRLAHELSQMNLFLKKANDPQSIEKLTRTMSKIMKTYEELKIQGNELDKRTTQLDVHMSKASFVFQSAQEKINKANVDFERQQLRISDQEAKQIRKVLLSSTESIQSTEKTIVESLQNMFQNSKESIRIESQLIKSFQGVVAFREVSEISNISLTNP